MNTPASSPQLVCVACTKKPVGVYDLVCDECRPAMEQAGLLTPTQPDTRIQIGPTDV